MKRPKKRRYQRRELARINERIRSSRVRVIDTVKNQQLGVMDTRQAVKLAKEYGLDLVEVASNTDPPVCKIVDYGKHKYEQSKQKKDGKPKTTSRVKEVKFRVRIGDHDYRIKMEHAEEFLDAGHKLRVQLQFRGREMAHQEIGMQLMHRVKDDLAGMGHVDMPPRQSGRQIVMMLSPLPPEQRKPNFFVRDEDLEEEPEDEDVDAAADGGEEDAGAEDAVAEEAPADDAKAAS